MSIAPNNTIGDGITDANLLTLSRIADRSVSVFDGTTLLGTPTADTNGAWSFTSSTLSIELQTFTATPMDAAGNISLASRSVCR